MSEKNCINCKYITYDTDTEPCLKCRFGKGGDYPLMWELKKDDHKGDQTAKADFGKIQLTLVPRQIIRDIAKVRMYGNQKYGDPENWKQVEPERYRDAAFRHFLAYLDDPNGTDEESGIKHLHHLACNIAFLCEMEKET